MKCVIPVLGPEPAVTMSAEAIGAAATAAAAAPAIASDLKRFSFANMPIAYHPGRGAKPHFLIFLIDFSAREVEPHNRRRSK
jgi:hypothetical protein